MIQDVCDECFPTLSDCCCNICSVTLQGRGQRQGRVLEDSEEQMIMCSKTFQYSPSVLRPTLKYGSCEMCVTGGAGGEGGGQILQEGREGCNGSVQILAVAASAFLCTIKF